MILFKVYCSRPADNFTIFNLGEGDVTDSMRGVLSSPEIVTSEGERVQIKKFHVHPSYWVCNFFYLHPRARGRGGLKLP